jgi:glyoxylase-like metal-dependent hydrolase (beta-lactamase superfamily II)
MTGTHAAELDIVPVLDGVMELDPLDAFPGTSASDWESHRDLLGPSGTIVMPYGGFLVGSPSGGITLVDTGGGPTFTVPPDKARLLQAGRLPEALNRLGVAPSRVDTVVLTHLHFDHIGWVAPEGKPFFPNAEVLCHEADWAHFVDSPEVPEANIPALLSGCEDNVVLWDGDRCTRGDLVLRHTPGHTPGSCIVVTAGARGGAAIVGDLVHTPIEFIETLDGIADTDPEMAAGTREAFKSECLRSQITLWGSHFPAMNPGTLREGPRPGTTVWDVCCEASSPCQEQ